MIHRMAQRRRDRNDFEPAAMTKDELGNCSDLFGREYDDGQPLPMLTDEERELVMDYVITGCVLDQFPRLPKRSARS
jgi:hypothetical protein